MKSPKTMPRKLWVAYITITIALIVLQNASYIPILVKHNSKLEVFAAILHIVILVILTTSILLAVTRLFQFLIKRQKDYLIATLLFILLPLAHGLFMSVDLLGVLTFTSPSLAANNEEMNSTTSLKDSLFDDPNLFISINYKFGIVFPSTDPQEIEGGSTTNSGTRFQVLEEDGGNNYVYSVTATKGILIPENTSLKQMLYASANAVLMLNKAEQYKSSKKLINKGEYFAILFDSHYIHSGIELPKKTMLMIRESDSVLFDVSIIGTDIQGVEKRFADYAKTFVILR